MDSNTQGGYLAAALEVEILQSVPARQLPHSKEGEATCQNLFIPIMFSASQLFREWQGCRQHSCTVAGQRTEIHIQHGGRALRGPSVFFEIIICGM